MSWSESQNEIRQRQLMVQQQLRGRGISDEKVLRIMGRLPRQHFIPAAHRSEAYFDQPVPIGLGQTISQPYIVALMTEKLQLQPSHLVLEIGTGCGYQTAILAQQARRIYTIERIETLAHQARYNLTALNITNVEYYVGDGTLGWPRPLAGEAAASEENSTPDQKEIGVKAEKPQASKKPLTAAFNRVLVAAAPEVVPPALLDQLADDGKMVIPVGPPHDQRLLLLEKKIDQNRQIKIKETLLCYCRFVKLICNSD